MATGVFCIAGSSFFVPSNIGEALPDDRISEPSIKALIGCRFSRIRSRLRAE
jgi:hypothetical protein